MGLSYLKIAKITMFMLSSGARDMARDFHISFLNESFIFINFVALAAEVHQLF